MDRAGTTANGVCAIMDEQGFSFDEIKAYLTTATHTNEYFYIDEIPSKEN